MLSTTGGKLTVVGTAVAIVAGTLTIANQAQVAEPMWLATRGFVRTGIEDQRSWIKTQFAPIKDKLITQEMTTLRGERNAARDKLFDLEVLQKKDAVSPDVARIIELQKRELQDRIERINEQIDKLSKENR